MTARRQHLVLGLLLAAIAGCRSTPALPQHALVSATDTIAAMNERTAALTALTAKGNIELISEDRRVQLDSIYVLRMPSEARIRAWKFGQAVFDLTLLKDEAFVFVPRESSAPGDITNGTQRSADAIRQWMAFLSRVPNEPDTRYDEAGPRLVLTTPHKGGQLIVEIDRPTQTVSSYRFFDSDKKERFTLSLTRYQLFNGTTLWPARIEARSDGGTIVISTRSLEPNVAAAAFKPPSRATRLP